MDFPVKSVFIVLHFQWRLVQRLRWAPYRTQIWMTHLLPTLLWRFIFVVISVIPRVILIQLGTFAKDNILSPWQWPRIWRYRNRPYKLKRVGFESFFDYFNFFNGLWNRVEKLKMLEILSLKSILGKQHLFVFQQDVRYNSESTRDHQRYGYSKYVYMPIWDEIG